ncbi:MAG: DUF932 domain-containing protein, partial [Steroidobacteraceae bacterium]
GHPAQSDVLKESSMDTSISSVLPQLTPRFTNVFSGIWGDDQLKQGAPAIYATEARDTTSATYRFISTASVIDGLRNVGFEPVHARQAIARHGATNFGRHLVRFRRRFETVEVADAVPELCLLNSHDGTSAYQLRVGLYRAVCRNGLMVTIGGFHAVYIAHRGVQVETVVTRALEVAERFGHLGEVARRMTERVLTSDEQHGFAARALALRFAPEDQTGMRVDQVLETRRAEDAGDDLWRVYNRAQESLMAGGLHRRSESGRLTRTRRIRAIREEVRINTSLWQIATHLLAA